MTRGLSSLALPWASVSPPAPQESNKKTLESLTAMDHPRESRYKPINSSHLSLPLGSGAEDGLLLRISFNFQGAIRRVHNVHFGAEETGSKRRVMSSGSHSWGGVRLASARGCLAHRCERVHPGRATACKGRQGGGSLGTGVHRNMGGKVQWMWEEVARISRCAALVHFLCPSNQFIHP